MGSHDKPPRPKNIPEGGWIRRHLRRGLFGFLRKLAATDDARSILTGSLRGLLRPRPILPLPFQELPVSPYPGLGTPLPDAPPRDRAPVFITARFRTGSTLLWNIFRHVEGCTAYYEPLNERRWFDPTARGTRKDPTHREVTDYWREYDGLEVLGDYYRERWIDHDLLMDEHDWDPDLKRYIEILIRRATGRPVLQFNRIDFRLAWLRRHFPQARLVHLYRHPRDQWCSTLPDLERFPKDSAVEDFPPHDGFYLLNWARDLRYHFPFLDERRASHPYQLFYYLWKLSFLYGKCYAHHSLSFEDLVRDPVPTLTKLFTVLEIPGPDLARLRGLLAPPRLGRWRDYAPESWFEQQESACERELMASLRDGMAPPTGPGGRRPELAPVGAEDVLDTAGETRAHWARALPARPQARWRPCRVSRSTPASLLRGG